MLLLGWDIVVSGHGAAWEFAGRLLGAAVPVALYSHWIGAAVVVSILYG